MHLANVDQQRSDQPRAIKPVPAAERRYYTVLGCADGWLAYSISDEGVRALQLDGGNAWFKSPNCRTAVFCAMSGKTWANVFNWEFQATNNQGLTAQQAMDKEFAAKGTPGRPAASAGRRGPGGRVASASGGGRVGT